MSNRAQQTTRRAVAHRVNAAPAKGDSNLALDADFLSCLSTTLNSIQQQVDIVLGIQGIGAAGVQTAVALPQRSLGSCGRCRRAMIEWFDMSHHCFRMNRQCRIEDQVFMAATPRFHDAEAAGTRTIVCYHCALPLERQQSVQGQNNEEAYDPEDPSMDRKINGS